MSCIEGLSASIATASTGLIESGLFAYVSDPGDYLGGGRQKTVTTDDGEFTVDHAKGLVVIAFNSRSSPAAGWMFYFRAPRGSPLLPGIFAATSEGSPRKAWIAIVGEGRGCGFIKGEFEVREAQYTLAGDVERFAVDFQVRCENRDPIFAGVIRINSSVPLPPDRTATPTPPADQFVLHLVSEPGDPVGRGRTIDLSAAQGSSSAEYYGSDDLRRVVALQLGDGVHEEWLLELAPPVCVSFVEGIYAGARQHLREKPLEPGLNVSVFHDGAGSNCLGLVGQFKILEAQLGEDGEVYRLAAEIEQRCTGGTGSLRGSVSYTSIRPTPTPAPPSPTPSDYSSVAILYTEMHASDESFATACFPEYLTLSQGEFSASYADGELFIVYEGGANSWWFQFGAAAGEDLTVGTYTQVSGQLSARANQSRFSINGPRVGCDDGGGQVRIEELEVSPDGSDVRFAAEFLYNGFRCGSGLNPTVYGAIRFRSGLLRSTPEPFNPPTPTLVPICWGDCSDNGEVTIDELIVGVKLALGVRPRPLCPRIDADRDEIVTIGELIRAVQSSMHGCVQ